MDRFRTRVLLALVAVVFVAAACSNSDGTSSSPSSTAGGSSGTAAASGDRNTFVPITGVPGVTDTAIDYAIIGTKTNNPLGTCILDCYAAGIKAYFQYQNDQGGIYGRKLGVSDVIDDELGQNQARSIEVISSGKAFGVFNATLVAAGFGDLNDAGIPTYVWNIHGAETAGRMAIFGNAPSLCATCTTRSESYLIKNAGVKKIAVLGYGVSENSKQCASARKQSIEKYASVTGAQVVYFNDDVAFGLPNGIGPEVTAMKDAGADFITTCMDLNGMKTLGQELERQGMTNVVMSHPNTYNQQFVTDAGTIFEGDYVTPTFLPFESSTNNELQAKFKEYIAKAGQEPSELAFTGWINAHQAFTGLLNAGPDFTRQKVIDSTNSLTNDPVGGLVPPINWTIQHTPEVEGVASTAGAVECFAPVKITNGKFVTVAPADKPFLCWSNSSLDWSEPQPTAFPAS